MPVIYNLYCSLGVLSIDGKCKSFDETADGYVRSEAASVILLQKAKNAKRIYAEVCKGLTAIFIQIRV